MQNVNDEIKCDANVKMTQSNHETVQSNHETVQSNHETVQSNHETVQSNHERPESNDSCAIECQVVRLLNEKKLTLVTAESCTGGMISAKLVAVPGVSEVFLAGLVTYANKAKRRFLSVKKNSLKEHGAVSEKVAKQMAIGAKKSMKADAAISVTGIAGPGGGTLKKPVGLVYIGCTVCDKTKVIKRNFTGSRQEIREAATQEALTLLYNCLKEC